MAKKAVVDKFTIPETFQLVGITWRVVYNKHMDELGLCKRDEATIYIKEGLPQPIAAATFAHELVHAIKFARGETEHDEKDVDSFGNLLHQFFITRT